ncbi:hypothetical protein STEG23_032362, partial [Scotinomys teguina]
IMEEEYLEKPRKWLILKHQLCVSLWISRSMGGPSYIGQLFLPSSRTSARWECAHKMLAYKALDTNSNIPKQIDKVPIEDPTDQGNWHPTRSQSHEGLCECRTQASQLTLDCRGGLSSMSEGPEERSPWDRPPARQIRGVPFGTEARFPYHDLDALAYRIFLRALSLTGLLKLGLIVGCGSLHLLPSVTGERLYDDSLDIH